MKLLKSLLKSPFFVLGLSLLVLTVLLAVLGPLLPKDISTLVPTTGLPGSGIPGLGIPGLPIPTP